MPLILYPQRVPLFETIPPTPMERAPPSAARGVARFPKGALSVFRNTFSRCG